MNAVLKQTIASLQVCMAWSLPLAWAVICGKHPELQNIQKFQMHLFLKRFHTVSRMLVGGCSASCTKWCCSWGCVKQQQPPPNSWKIAATEDNSYSNIERVCSWNLTESVQVRKQWSEISAYYPRSTHSEHESSEPALPGCPDVLRGLSYGRVHIERSIPGYVRPTCCLRSPSALGTPRRRFSLGQTLLSSHLASQEDSPLDIAKESPSRKQIRSRLAALKDSSAFLSEHVGITSCEAMLAG